MRDLRIVLAVIILTGLTVLSSFAQSQVDLTFNAAPSLATSNTATKGQVVQADGKVVVWGGALNEGSLIKGLVARLNTDGSLDTSFNFCGCSFSAVTAVFIEANGKMLVSGTNSANRAKVIRIFTNGSIDTVYATPFTGAIGTTGNVATIRALQPDGQALIHTGFNGNSIGITSYLNRYQVNGLIDNSFTPVWMGNEYLYVPDVALAPDGKFFIAHNVFSSSPPFVYLHRYNSDGTIDESWNGPANPLNQAILGLDVQPDGSLIVSGPTSLSGVSTGRVGRVLPAGNVDLTFAASGFNSVSQVKVLSSGKILISASTGAGIPNRIFRLNSDGSTDNSLVKQAAPIKSKAEKQEADLDPARLVKGKERSVREDEFVQTASTTVLNRFSLDPAEKVVFFGMSDTAEQQFYRLDASGTFDATFDSNLSEFGKIAFMLRQPDGKVVIYGTFINVNGIFKSTFARLNTNGSLDNSFDGGAAFDIDPLFMLVQPDGKILASGTFTSYNGAPVSKIVRINNDGSLDAGFTPSVPINVNTLTLQPDGKILAGGSGAVRLNSDGTADNSFSVTIGSANVKAIVVQADGKIIVGGNFLGVNGFNRFNLVRLNSDGSLDQTYNPTQPNGPGFVSLWMQPDGKILACTISAGEIFMDRLNADGSTDLTFTQVRFAGVSFSTRINSVAFRANGEILVAGNFSKAGLANTPYFAWINAAGRVQPLIFPEGVNGIVKNLAFQPDGKLLMGGEFSRIDNTPRAGVARIALANFHGAPQFDFDGDGRADIGVFRPSEGNWYLAKSTNGFSVSQWGLGSDRLVTADYDGDGKSDLAIYRDGAWWYIKSTNSTFSLVNFGSAGDIPLPSDFDGDSKADFIFFRPTTGEWFRSGSTGVVSNIQFGLPDDIPLIADFDGDGKSDPTIFRPSDGIIWYVGSVDGLFYAHPWGKPGDIPVLGDYDGDGKTDPAVFRGNYWFIFYSHDGSYSATQWGFNDDRPTPADYDGDGRTDIAIYRPSNGMWFILQSTSGPVSLQFGLASDKAIPNAFLP